jgi:DnaJ like chaperone protein
MSKGASWSDLLDRSIQAAIDKFLKNFENKSKTYKTHKSSFDKYAQTSTKSELKGKFANNLLVLTAAVMKADGKVLKSELTFVKEFFHKQFPKNFADVRIQMLKDVLKMDYPYQKASKLILETMPLAQRKYLLEYLFQLAKADGAIVKEEIKVIDSIAMAMGYAGAGYQTLKAKYIKIASQSDYAILGIKKDATDDEVKKAYRKLAKIHHPDKFTGEDDSIRIKAKKEFQKISNVYESIMKTRGRH